MDRLKRGNKRVAKAGRAEEPGWDASLDLGRTWCRLGARSLVVCSILVYQWLLWGWPISGCCGWPKHSEQSLGGESLMAGKEGPLLNVRQTGLVCCLVYPKDSVASTNHRKKQCSG